MNKKSIKLLLIEDDNSMGFLLVEFLESNGFVVDLYKDGKEGLSAFFTSHYDFCVFDVMLPGIDGFSIAKEVRKADKKVPIVFLTAKALKEDKIEGFNIGVDDYIVKPFDEDELLCRIYAIMNRVSNMTEVEAEKNVFKIGEFLFDYRNLCLQYKETGKRLTQKENEVLKILVENKNQVVKRDDILIKLWGDNDYFNGRSLDVFIAKIRKYLKLDSYVKIENIPGVGFLLKD